MDSPAKEKRLSRGRPVQFRWGTGETIEVKSIWGGDSAKKERLRNQGPVDCGGGGGWGGGEGSKRKIHAGEGEGLKE